MKIIIGTKIKNQTMNNNRNQIKDQMNNNRSQIKDQIKNNRN